MLKRSTSYNPNENMTKNSVGEYPQPWTDTAAINEAANNFAIKMSLLDFANKTSLNGPPFIIASTNWITRLIWIFLFIAGIGLTIYNVVENTLNYTSWPKQTELSLDFSRLTFPMITVCNVNPIRRSKIRELPEDLIEFLKSLKQDNLKRNQSISVPQGRKKRFIDNDQYTGNTNKSYIPDKYKKHEKSALGGDEDTTNYIKDTFEFLYGAINHTTQVSVGHRMKDMLLACSFETRSCTKEDFTPIQSNAYGNCYTFNPNGQYKAKRRGQQYGLSLMLYLENDEYIMGLTSGYGVRVTISDQNQLPFPDVDGIYVGSMSETDIGIRMVNLSRLGAPYGACENNDKYTDIYGVVYTRQFCQSTCEHRYIEVNCSCFEQNSIRYYPKDTNSKLPHCETDEEVDCMTEIKRMKLANELSCKCASPCNEKTFDTQISSRLWPTNDYLDALIDKVCREDIKKNDVNNCNHLIGSNEFHKMRNFLKLNIFYRELNFQSITETAQYPWYTYLSDLGGAVGLYLGLSVLGLFEIIHLLFIIGYQIYQRMKKVGQARPRPASNGQHNMTSNM